MPASFRVRHMPITSSAVMPSGARLTVLRAVRSISSQSRPTSSQWPRKTSSFWRITSGPPVREQVAGVGVLRDQSQRLLLAHRTDHDRRARITQDLGAFEWLCQVVVHAVVGFDLAGPHLVGDLERLKERSKRSFADGYGTPNPSASRSFQPAPMPR